MLDEGNEFNLEGAVPPPGERSDNRTFLIVAGIMAGVVFLTIVCAAVYVLVFRPKQLAASQATQSAIATANYEIELAGTATALAMQWTATPQASPTLAATDTPTPVLAMGTETPTQPSDPLTATMAALQTQVALAQLTPTSTRISAMPTTGFFDDYGLPGLMVMAGALVVVILLARRLRKTPTR